MRLDQHVEPEGAGVGGEPLRRAVVQVAQEEEDGVGAGVAELVERLRLA